MYSNLANINVIVYHSRTAIFLLALILLLRFRFIGFVKQLL